MDLYYEVIVNYKKPSAMSSTSTFSENSKVQHPYAYASVLWKI